ncbi:MAG: N-acetylmuramoyl-L-alanine amidase [Smithellaceae bacterium]|jgi:N-acetylmuramoyl-L-alanine amidase
MIYKIKKLCLMGIWVLAFFMGGALPVLAAGEKHVIVIDPSHGGQDTGVKIKDKVDEKDITLIIALALQKELAQENNLQIILTRDSDRELGLEDRKKIVEKIKPNFFLSIHVNSGFGKTASGFELYYPGFKDITERKTAVNVSARQAKNKCLNDAVKMSHLIQKNLDAVFPRKGRGLREAETPIIEGLSVPALVVEIGFATNSEDKKKLLSPDTQVEIAQALVRSIKSFFR